MVASARSALAAAPLCCRSLADAPRAPLPANDTQVSIGTDRPVYEFDGQRAYFVIFELPAYTTPYSILIESQATDRPPTYDASAGPFGKTSLAKTLMAVTIVMLDANNAKLRVFESGAMRSRGDNLEQTIFINPDNADERYMLVYASDRRDALAKTYSHITATPILAGGVMVTIISGEDQAGSIHFSPTGTLRVQVSPPAR